MMEPTILNPIRTAELAQAATPSWIWDALITLEEHPPFSSPAKTSKTT